MSTTQTTFSTSRSGGSTELCAASEKILHLVGDPFVSLSPDGRSRSSRGSSSDEDTQAWDGFVNEDFRAGGPYICPLPALSFTILPGNRLFQRLQRDQPALAGHITSILRRANVDVHAVSFCGRKWEFETEAGPVTTVFIRATKHSLNEDWVTPSRDVRQFLFEQGIQNISVEICDRRAVEPDKIHPVPPADPVFPIWTQVRNTILHNCNTRGWNSIGCHRIGKNDDSTLNPSTILVTVDDTDKDWRDTREMIVSILDGFALSSLAVKVKRDEIVQLGSELLKPAFPRSALADNAQVGQSVGHHGYEGGSGTFGGWIELYNPDNGRWYLYGLTCSHVVLPEDEPELAKYRVHGVMRNDRANEHLRVDSPSAKDLAEHKNELIDRLKCAVNEDYIEYEKVDRDPTGFLIPPHRAYLEMQRKYITELERQVQEVESFTHQNRQYLGHVQGATGNMRLKTRGEDLPMTLDWAILGIPSHRWGDNNVFTFGPTSIIPAGDELSLRAEPSVSVGATGTLFKCGRATGYTVGRYGYLQEARFATIVSHGQVVKQPTREHVILGCGQPFSRPGDSGALVFKPSGAVVGMIVGSHQYDNIAYITSIEDLVEDIKAATGASDVRIQPRT